MIVKIVYKTGSQEKANLFSDTKEIMIGRSSTELDLRKHKDIDEIHAHLFYDMGVWWIEDLASSTGVFYLGAKIARPTIVTPNNSFKIGITNFTVSYKPPEDSFDAETGVIDAEITPRETLPEKGISETQRIELFGKLSLIAEQQVGKKLLDEFIKELIGLFPTMDSMGILLYKDKELIPISYFPGERSHVSFTLARRTIVNRKAFIWEKSSASVRSRGVSSLQDIVSTIYVPLIRGKIPLGVIHININSMSKSFNENDLNLLSEVAKIVTLFIKDFEFINEEIIPSVFISYSHKDALFTQRLINDLRRESISVWYDERLHTGEDWREQLSFAIKKTDTFILMMTDTSLTSEYVQWEIEKAKELGKTILPIVFQKTSIPEDWGRIHYLNFTGEYESKLFELIEELHSRRSTR